MLLDTAVFAFAFLYYAGKDYISLVVKSSLDDEKNLLIRLRGGDVAAFDQLYRCTVNLVFRRIKRLVHIHAVAEELTQDVFYQIWKQREKIDPLVPFPSIAMRTAKSIAINFYQKAIREHQLKEQLVSAGSAAYNPLEEEIDFNETRELLEKAIAKLPPQRQRVFNLCKIQGKTYEFAAAELGVSVGTIKDHMAKAMRFLKEELISRSGKAPLYAVLVVLLFR